MHTNKQKQHRKLQKKEKDHQKKTWRKGRGQRRDIYARKENRGSEKGVSMGDKRREKTSGPVTGTEEWRERRARLVEQWSLKKEEEKRGDKGNGRLKLKTTDALP